MLKYVLPHTRILEILQRGHAVGHGHAVVQPGRNRRHGVEYLMPPRHADLGAHAPHGRNRVERRARFMQAHLLRAELRLRVIHAVIDRLVLARALQPPQQRVVPVENEHAVAGQAAFNFQLCPENVLLRSQVLDV